MQIKLQEQSFKARSLKTYLRNFFINCYHFCQQYEDYFKTSSATKINCTSFAASFFYGTISL